LKNPSQTACQQGASTLVGKDFRPIGLKQLQAWVKAQDAPLLE
jgi:hypothetical protein